MIALLIAVENLNFTSMQKLLQTGVDTTLRDKASQECSRNCLIIK